MNIRNYDKEEMSRTRSSILFRYFSTNIRLVRIMIKRQADHQTDDECIQHSIRKERE
jgi:hypothetical protein